MVMVMTSFKRQLYVILTVFFGFILICYYYDYTKSNDRKTITIKNFEKVLDVYSIKWPIQWEILLNNSEKLKLVLIDETALKCIFTNKMEKTHACNGLFGNYLIRLGTIEQNSNQFEKLLDEYLLNDERFNLDDKIKNDKSYSYKIVYTSDMNFNKTIIITQLVMNKSKYNYHLLNGFDDIRTIAVRHFYTTSIKINNNTRILIPKNVDNYLHGYKNGEFVECNKKLAKLVKKTREKERSIPPGIVNVLTIFVDDLYTKTGQTAFLSFGTLLGWYRECDIIPHTTDMDFYVFAHEYPEGFEEKFKTKHYSPSRRIGIKDYGYELTFWLHHDIKNFTSISTDIFYLFDYNATAQWSPLLYDFENLKRAKHLVPRITRLCSADLYGHLYNIPCNFKDVLKWNYGSKWNESYKAGYFETEMQTFFDGNWKGNLSDFLTYF